MSDEDKKIVLPFEPKNKKRDEPETKEITINYEATEEDEEKFMLMYHMNMQPSEVDALDVERRRWILARFMGQKQMEREAFEQRAMMQALSKGGGIKLPE